MSVGQPLVDGAYVEAAAQGGEGVQVGGALHVYVSSIKDARLPTYLPTYLGNLCCHHRADYHSRTPQGRGSDRLQTQEKDAWFG